MVMPPTLPIGLDVDTSSGDFSITQGGDIALVAGPAMVQEHIASRLYDKVGARLFEPTLGAGLSGWVGEPLNPTDLDGIAQTVLAQTALVSGVASVLGATAVQQSLDTILVLVTVTLVGQTGATVLPVVIGGRAAPLFPVTVTGS